MKPRTLTRHHRHLLEVASLLATAGVADAFADLFGRVRHGSDVLIVIGVALVLCTIGHHVWLRRTNHAPPAEPTAPSGPLWRVRTRIDNTPGRLAVLAGALAAAGANIHALEAYPAADGVVDEFLIEAAPTTTAEHLCAAVRAVGGRDVHALPADVLALLDAPTRALELAGRLARNPGDFDAVLTDLLEAQSVSTVAAGVGEPRPAASRLDGTSLVLRRADGRTVTVSRPGFPFTGTELSRARTLVEFADSLCAPRCLPTR
jgi:hypothetical protein